MLLTQVWLVLREGSRFQQLGNDWAGNSEESQDRKDIRYTHGGSVVAVRSTNISSVEE